MTKQEDKAWKDYGQRFRREVLPKIMDSAVFLSIGTEVGDFDVRQATELGAALLMGKPVLLVLPKGRRLGAGMRRAADVIVDNFDPRDPASQERIAEALEQIGHHKSTSI
jgi:hypothetical protein